MVDYDITALAYHPTTPTLYAGTKTDGVYISTDSGVTWTQTGTGTQLGSLEVLCLFVDPNAANTCYAGTLANLYCTIDGGTNWYLPGGPPGGTDPTDSRIISLMVDPGNSDLVYAGGFSGGFFRTTATAADPDFAAANAGLNAARIWAVGLDSQTANNYFAGGGFDPTGGTSIGYVFSINSGANWSPPAAAPAGTNIVALAPHPTAGQTLYAAVNGSGVWQSTDGGDNWSAVWTGPTSNNVLAVAIVDTTVNDTLLAGCDTTGAWRSTDNGASWSAVTGIPAADSVRDFALDPVSPNNVYAASDSGVYISTDGGINWTAATTHPTFSFGTLSSSSINCVLVDPGVNTTVYAGTDGGGVFVSSDSGDIFAPANLHIGGSGNVRVFDLASQSIAPFYIFAVANTGLFRTADRAASWNPVHDDDTTLTKDRDRKVLVGRSLAVDPHSAGEKTLLVGTEGRGVMVILFP